MKADKSIANYDNYIKTTPNPLKLSNIVIDLPAAEKTTPTYPTHQSDHLQASQGLVGKYDDIICIILVIMSNNKSDTSMFDWKVLNTYSSFG